MKLLCLGDIAVSVNSLPDADYYFPNFFAGDDDTKVLFNMELPVGRIVNPIPRQRGPRLLSDPILLDMIRGWSPGFATLATNHILDAGVEGLDHTLTSLSEAGFTTVGAGMTSEEIIKPLFWETEEGKIGILNWVFPETHPDWLAVPGPNCWPGIDEAQKQIQTIKKQVDWVLVITHWSDELFPYPRPEDRVVARAIAGAGADILISHHPHVVRGMEVIGSCPVFYSLGNFYFSDYKDETGKWIAKWAPRNRESLAVVLSFKHGAVPEYNFRSYNIIKDRIVDDIKNRGLNRMIWLSAPLSSQPGFNYNDWYIKKRKPFDRVWVRLQFRIYKLGVKGVAQLLLGKVKHRLTDLLSKKEDDYAAD